MITLILPGYSPGNKKWAEEVAQNIDLEGQIRPIFWDHWTDPEKTFKPKEKAELLVNHSKGEKLNLIGKSVGTLVASYIAKEIPDQVNKIILCGIPSTSDKRLEIYKESFGKLKAEKIIVFQNTTDPFGSYKEVKEFMKRVSPGINVIEKPGTDHDYPYYEDFNKFLS